MSAANKYSLVNPLKAIKGGTFSLLFDISIYNLLAEQESDETPLISKW